MKILISNSFKALRQGKFVKANTDDGEFIIDTKECEAANATLIEIAKANKIEIGSQDKKQTLLEKLEKGFLKSKIPEQNQMSDTDKVDKIVAAGVELGLDDEDMIVQIIQSGIKYKAASKMFLAAMTSGGFRISTKDRKEQANTILVEAEFNPENNDDVNEAVRLLMEEVADTTEAQAIKICKTYCKAYEIEFPKPEKKARASFKTRFQEFVLEHPICTYAQVKAWVLENKKDEKAAKRLWSSVEFAQKVAVATIALEDSEEAAE